MQGVPEGDAHDHAISMLVRSTETYAQKTREALGRIEACLDTSLDVARWSAHEIAVQSETMDRIDTHLDNANDGISRTSKLLNRFSAWSFNLVGSKLAGRQATKRAQAEVKEQEHAQRKTKTGTTGGAACHRSSMLHRSNRTGTRGHACDVTSNETIPARQQAPTSQVSMNKETRMATAHFSSRTRSTSRRLVEYDEVPGIVSSQECGEDQSLRRIHNRLHGLLAMAEECSDELKSQTSQIQSMGPKADSAITKLTAANARLKYHLRRV